MPSTNNTVLAHVLPTFTNQMERAATEALSCILNQSAPAKYQLEGLLRQAGVIVGPILNCETEVGHEAKGRADLVAYDSKGREIVLVEVKFWAKLTDHQPNSYLARLETRVPSALLFLCPETRMEQLWVEILGRCDRRFGAVEISGGGSLRTANIGNGSRKLMLTSWQHLLTTIANGCSEQDKHNIAQLEGLVAYMEKDRFVPWEETDLDEDIPRKIQGLRRLVIDAVESGKRGDWGITEQSEKVSAGIECGQYLFLGGVGVWFGVDFSAWAKHGGSPLWVQLNQEDLPQDGKALQRIKRNSTISKYMVDEHYHHFPIDLPVGEDVSSVVASVVRQLNRIARLIDSGTNHYRWRQQG